MRTEFTRNFTFDWIYDYQSYTFFCNTQWDRKFSIKIALDIPDKTKFISFWRPYHPHQLI